jgi:hypothetical protein
MDAQRLFKSFLTRNVRAASSNVSLQCVPLRPRDASLLFCGLATDQSVQPLVACQC